MVSVDCQWLSGEQLFWHTWDHSFVANLVKLGEITREAARKPPRSNEIQKALLANFDGNCTKPEMHRLALIQEGDLMLLCSDGVNEAWGDKVLINVLFDKFLLTADKAKIIFDKCKDDANDNNTAFVLEWEKDSIFQPQNDESTTEWMSFNDAPVKENVSTSKNKKRRWKFF